MTCSCMNSKCYAAGRCLGAPAGEREIAWMQEQRKVMFFIDLSQQTKQGKTMSTNEAHCCHIGCEKPAEWVIYEAVPNKPDNDTHACTEHVGAQLSDAYEHRIFPISEIERKPPESKELDLEAALADALEGMEDMIGYVDEYFRKKWGHQDYIDRAKASLEAARRLRAGSEGKGGAA